MIVNFNGQSYEFECNSNDSFGECKRKCLKKLEQLRVPEIPTCENSVLLSQVSENCELDKPDFNKIESFHLLVRDTTPVRSDADPERLNAELKYDIVEYNVEWNGSRKRIGVFDIDSLRTFLTKLRDTFGEDCNLDTIETIHQIINDEHVYMYKAADNPDMRKRIEHFTNITTNETLYVTSRPVSKKPMFLHFCIKDGHFKQIPCGQNDKLSSLTDTLDVPKVVDLRVRSRSVYNKANGIVQCDRNTVTVSDCGLTAGDIIDVITVDPTCIIYNVREGGSLNQEKKLKFGSGETVESWKNAIMHDLNRLAGTGPSFLFQLIKKDKREFYKPLYDAEELASVDIREGQRLLLWMNCSFINDPTMFNINKRNENFNAANPEMVNSDFYEWPWGNSENKYWTWGIMISETSTDGAVTNHFLIRTTDDGYYVCGANDSVEKEFNPYRSRIPGTPKQEAQRKVSMFVCLFRNKPEMKLFKPKKIVLMKRNTKDCLPYEDNPNVNSTFWVKSAALD